MALLSALPAYYLAGRALCRDVVELVAFEASDRANSLLEVADKSCFALDIHHTLSEQLLGILLPC